MALLTMALLTMAGGAGRAEATCTVGRRRVRSGLGGHSRGLTPTLTLTLSLTLSPPLTRYGAFLLEEPDVPVQLVATLARELSVPVTAKARIPP